MLERFLKEFEEAHVVKRLSRAGLAQISLAIATPGFDVVQIVIIDRDDVQDGEREVGQPLFALTGNINIEAVVVANIFAAFFAFLQSVVVQYQSRLQLRKWYTM